MSIPRKIGGHAGSRGAKHLSHEIPQVCQLHLISSPIQQAYDNGKSQGDVKHVKYISLLFTGDEWLNLDKEKMTKFVKII